MMLGEGLPEDCSRNPPDRGITEGTGVSDLANPSPATIPISTPRCHKRPRNAAMRELVPLMVQYVSSACRDSLYRIPHSLS